MKQPDNYVSGTVNHQASALEGQVVFPQGSCCTGWKKKKGKKDLCKAELYWQNSPWLYASVPFWLRTVFFRPATPCWHITGSPPLPCFCSLFPRQATRQVFLDKWHSESWRTLLCKLELVFRSHRNLLKELEVFNCFSGPSMQVLHIFISYYGTIHIIACESEWIFLATNNAQEVNLPNPKLFSVLPSPGICILTSAAVRLLNWVRQHSY